MNSYALATVTFGGIEMPVQALEWERRAEDQTTPREGSFERIATVYGPITFSLRLFGEQLEDFRRAIFQLSKLSKREKGRRRAWYRREAQRVFRHACRKGARLNASAAEVRRALQRGWGLA